MAVPPPSSNSSSNSRHCVLLVEDEPFVRDATCRVLRQSGFDVIAAANAGEAVRLFDERRSNIDLLITDVVLPKRNGRELGQYLRQIAPRIPILLTSGYIEQDDSESEEARTYYLQKPYTKTELISKIEKILERPLRRAATQAG
jgi:two-component system, cell cycle sensor histidine kinase and response regulator CckA